MPEIINPPARKGQHFAVSRWCIHSRSHTAAQDSIQKLHFIIETTLDGARSEDSLAGWSIDMVIVSSCEMRLRKVIQVV